MDVTDFGGQNWLIMPAARAVNEAAPANISRQRWLLVISGVTVINMQGRASGEVTAVLVGEDGGDYTSLDTEAECQDGS